MCGEYVLKKYHTSGIFGRYCVWGVFFNKYHMPGILEILLYILDGRYCVWGVFLNKYHIRPVFWRYYCVFWRNCAYLLLIINTVCTVFYELFGTHCVWWLA